MSLRDCAGGLRPGALRKDRLDIVAVNADELREGDVGAIGLGDEYGELVAAEQGAHPLTTLAQLGYLHAFEGSGLKGDSFASQCLQVFRAGE